MSLINERLQNFLDQNKVEYHVVHHRTDYSTQFAAEDTHTPGHKFLKPVVVGIGEPEMYAMVVIPADMHIDLSRLVDCFDVTKARVVSKQELADLFPDCEAGTLVPLGNLYGLPVFVDPALGDCDVVTFNAGSHDTAIRIKWVDYVRLVVPVPLPLGMK